MKYVCHRRYKQKGASGKKYILRRKTNLATIGKFIVWDNSAVCSITSDAAYKYFARNDDGNGLRRGELTYAIAFADRHPNEDNGFRFTADEAAMLRRDYSHFLLDDNDIIIFNFDFFNAEISDLEEIYNKLEAEKCIQ